MKTLRREKRWEVKLLWNEAINGKTSTQNTKELCEPTNV